MSQVAELITNAIQNLHNELEHCEEGKIKLDKCLVRLKNTGLFLKKSYDAMQEARNEMLCCVSDKNLRDDLKAEIKSFKKIYEKTRELFDSKKNELNILNDRIKVLYSEKRIAEESLTLIRIAEEKRAKELLDETPVAEENVIREQLTSANATTSYSRRKQRVDKDRKNDWANIPVGTTFKNNYKGENMFYVKTNNSMLLCLKSQTYYDSLSHAMRTYWREIGNCKSYPNAWTFFKVVVGEKDITIDNFLKKIDT